MRHLIHHRNFIKDCDMVFTSHRSAGIFVCITCGILSYCFLKESYIKHSKLNKPCTTSMPNWNLQTALYLFSSSTKDLGKLNSILQSWPRSLTNCRIPWLPLRKNRSFKNSAKPVFGSCTGLQLSIDLTIRTNMQICQSGLLLGWNAGQINNFLRSGKPC